MPIVAKNNDVLTVIDIYSVESSRQQELVDSLIDVVKSVWKQQPSFVSASIHRSLDAVRVANYAQWKSQQDYEAFAKNSNLQSLATKLSDFPRPDSHLYEVAIFKSRSDDSLPKISKGFITYFAEFRLKPENQQRLLDLAQENVVLAMENPGLIFATFHRSLDGTVVVNYGHWRSVTDFEALETQPQFAPLSQYWRGLTEEEVHLYEVVFTEPAE